MKKVKVQGIPLLSEITLFFCNIFFNDYDTRVLVYNYGNEIDFIYQNNIHDTCSKVLVTRTQFCYYQYIFF